MFTALWAATVTACAVGQLPNRAGAFPDPSVEVFAGHVRFLADPARGGRAPGSPGIEEAAAYIERTFDRLGLAPLFPDEDDDDLEMDSPRSPYRQRFELESMIALGAQRLVWNLPSGAEPLDPMIDFELFSAGGSGAFEALPVAFVGYSIPAGANGYLGYPPLTDLTGKVAIALRYEPMDALGRSLWRDDGWTVGSRASSKALAAARRGAAAVILVEPPGVDFSTGDDLDTLRTLDPDEPLTTGPILSVARSRVEELIGAAKFDEAKFDEAISLESLTARANQGAVVEDLPGVSVTLAAEVDRDAVVAENVGAVLPGRGTLASEYVVITAHHDGLGDGAVNSRRPDRYGEVHPGADANASGVAGLLVAARLVTAAYDRLGPGDDARSVIFLSFGASQRDFAGSTRYVERPPRPLRDHSLVINLDMIGTLGDNGRLEVGGLDSGVGLETLLRETLEARGQTFDTTPSLPAPWSDHDVFIAEQIPAVYFHTGLTDNYRSPDDTVDTLDLAGGARIARHAATLTVAAAMHSEPFDFSGPAGPARDDLASPGTLRVRVGIAPSAGGLGKGMRISQVFEDTSAAEAGLKRGDLLIEWDGKTITGVDDWQAILPEHTPGDEVTATVERGGKRVRVRLKLRGQ